MTRFPGILDMQVDSLLRELKQQQASRCQEIIAAAERTARELKAKTRRRLHRKRRQAVADERQRRRHALLEAASRIEAREQSSAHARYDKVLEASRPRLVAALAERWRHDASRWAWCEMLTGEAAALLDASSWTIEHPADWSTDDESRVVDACAERSIPSPVFRADPDIGAGLRIRRHDACLDGTLDGLLADRHKVDAQILGTWEALRRQGENGGR